VQYGRRQPRDGRTGIYLSLWINQEDLDLLDAVADRWGLTRSATLKQALHETHQRVTRQRTLRALDDP
jgi:hypothetical protein